MRHGATRGQRFPHKEALPVSAVCFLCKGISTIAIRYGRSPRAVPNTIKDKSMKWFRKEKEAGRLFYSTDLHSHILPGIDDGSPDIDTSIQLLRAMQSWGIKHIFATPHIIDDVYENSPATIEPACQVLKAKMTQEGIDMEVRYSAEYRMDEHFRELRQSGTAALIPLPGQRLLVENSFLQAPIDLDEILFRLMLDGIQPILAHPERYRYFHENKEIYHHLHSNGCHFQVNLLSLAGYYGKTIKEVAWWLCKNGMVEFLGSDLHTMEQADAISAWLSSKEFRKVEELLPSLQNDRLSTDK